MKGKTVLLLLGQLVIVGLVIHTLFCILFH